jgi:quercetin dioxygenase-like cupin family protein
MVVPAEIIVSRPIAGDLVLWTIRVQLPSGGGFPYWTFHDVTTIAVLSGKIGFTAVTGSATVIIGSERRSSFAGQEYLLSAGDIVVIGVGVQQSLRNPLTDDSVYLLTTMLPAGKTPFEGLPTSEGLVVELAR